MKIKYLGLICLGLGLFLFTVSVVLAGPPDAPPGQESSVCVECHSEETPGIVDQFRQSKKWEAGLDCSTCHGEEHTSADDVDQATLPTPDTCNRCHPDRVEQYQAGKHSLAWAAMDAIPMLHAQPIGIRSEQKGCGGCHKIGLKTGEDVGEYGYGLGACDSCHTRHTFSTAEARRPEACSTCHMGFDHPQWEMYTSSKHGVIYQVEGDTWDWDAKLGEGATYRAPTCQVCHMPEGDHAVLTSWGFLGLRVEEPDEEWAATRATILKAVGALDAEGNPGALFQGVADLQLARLTMDDWQAARDEMLGICGQCHSGSFAQANLEAGDGLLQEADEVLAHSIEIIKDLYQDGVLPEQAGYPSSPYPFILAFYDAPTSIEQDLYLSWLEYRQRAFQGAFHNSPDYMHWYGWAPLKETDRRIEDEAARLRLEAVTAEALPAVSTEMEDKLTQMESNLANLSDEVSGLTGSVQQLQGDVAALSDLDESVQQLQGEVSGLSTLMEQSADANIQIIALAALGLGLVALIVGLLAWRRRAS